MYNILIKAFPAITWKVHTQEKILFLTFDDGPEPEVTNEVLSLLKKYSAKATFFCSGKNISLHPDVFKRILIEGHCAGNHSYQHLNGWLETHKKYIEDVTRCNQVLIEHGIPYKNKQLFRPPYGKLKLTQYLKLKKDFKIVMWNVLSRDWEQKRNVESCIARIRKKTRPGSIIVFHDNLKAQALMKPALQATLSHFTGLGYRFESLEKYL